MANTIKSFRKISQKSTCLITSINRPAPFFCPRDQAMLNIKIFSETILEFWKFFKVSIRLVIHVFHRRYSEYLSAYSYLYQFCNLFEIRFHILTHWEKRNLIISFWSYDVWKKLQYLYFLWFFKRYVIRFLWI